MTTSRITKQRLAVLENLSHRFDHPTADEVYISLKETMPAISLATVYRNLKALCEGGAIGTVVTKDSVHYDAHVNDNHLHAICNCCGKIEDIRINVDSNLMNLANEQFSGELNSCKIIFHGLCQDCQNQIQEVI